MKKIKIVFILFIVICVTSALNVNANSLGINNITIPSMQGTYMTSIMEKTTMSDQYVKQLYAYDNVSGDGRAIQAMLQGVTLGYVNLVEGQYVKLHSTGGGYGQVPGEYRLILRSKKWLLTTAQFIGSWVLDDYLL